MLSCFVIWFSVCCPDWVIFIILCSKSLICSSALFILLFRAFVCVCVFLGPHLWHVEVSGLGVELELQLLACATATVMPDPNHICDLHHSSRQHWILNPLSEARDQTYNLMVPRQIRFCFATMGTPNMYSLKEGCMLGCNCHESRDFLSILHTPLSPASPNSARPFFFVRLKDFVGKSEKGSVVFKSYKFWKFLLWHSRLGSDVVSVAAQV